MKTQEKFKKNQTEWNNSNIDICDFNAFFSKQQKEGGKHIKKYIFLFVVFRLRLRINHNLQVSCFFVFFFGSSLLYIHKIYIHTKCL